MNGIYERGNRKMRRLLVTAGVVVGLGIGGGVLVLLASNDGESRPATHDRPSSSAGHGATDDSCERLTGFVDYNAAPSSAADLARMSQAVVLVRAKDKEHVVPTARTDSTKYFLLASNVRVDHVVTGDIAPGSTISVLRAVFGNDLDDALAQSECLIGGEQALSPGARYVIGLVRAEDGPGWYSVAGPYSTIRLRDGGTAAASSCKVIPGSDCDVFPYTINGTRFRTIVAEARAAE